MAFKYQKLTKEEAEYINSFKIPFAYGSVNVPLEFDNDDWTPIDRERNIYCLIAGGLGDKDPVDCPPMVSYLIMDDNLIRFETYHYRKKELNSEATYGYKLDYFYKIESIRAPLVLENKYTDEQIISVIKEALKARLIGLKGEKIGSVVFVDVAEPWYTDLDPRA